MTRTLGIDGFGDLSLAQSVIAFLLIFIGLNLDGAITRYYFRYGEKSISLTFISGIFYSLILTITGVIVSIYFNLYIIAICFICAFFQNLVNVQLTYRQIQKKVIQYLCIQLISSLTAVFLTFFILNFFVNSYEGRIYAITLSFLFTAIVAILIIPYDFKFNKKYSIQQLKLGFVFVAGFGAPLIFHNLSLFFKGQLDRFIVYANYTIAELGLYATGFQLASVLAVLLLALNKATLPYYFEALKNDKLTNLKIKKMIICSLFFIPIPSFFALVIPESLYEFILGPGFGGVKIYNVIFLLGVSMTLPYFIVVNYLFYVGKTKIISICSIISALLHVALLLTIGSIELRYTSLCLFITNTFTFIFLYLYMTKEKKFLELT